jgi:four helix bundle protein
MRCSQLDPPKCRGFGGGTECAALAHMPNPFTFRDLVVWKQGMDLAEQCYKATAPFPKSELYGLTGQLRRAAVSIPSNVAEGHGRRSTKAYMNHVSIAIGSQAEFATCVEIAARLGFIEEATRKRIVALSDSVGRLLYGLHRALKRKLADKKRNRRVTPSP